MNKNYTVRCLKILLNIEICCSSTLRSPLRLRLTRISRLHWVWFSEGVPPPTATGLTVFRPRPWSEISLSPESISPTVSRWQTLPKSRSSGLTDTGAQGQVLLQESKTDDTFYPCIGTIFSHGVLQTHWTVPSAQTVTVRYPEVSTAVFLHPWDRDGSHSSTSQEYRPLFSGTGFVTVRLYWLGSGWPNLSSLLLPIMSCSVALG